MLGLSAMLRGIPENEATVVDYKEEDLDKIFADFFGSEWNKTLSMQDILVTRLRQKASIIF